MSGEMSNWIIFYSSAEYPSVLRIMLVNTIRRNDRAAVNEAILRIFTRTASFP
jgi:hypothetical protein